MDFVLPTASWWIKGYPSAVDVCEAFIAVSQRLNYPEYYLDDQQRIKSAQHSIRVLGIIEVILVL